MYASVFCIVLAMHGQHPVQVDGCEQMGAPHRCCQKGQCKQRLLAKAHGIKRCRPAPLEGVTVGFNCCCQGSYNFPVPPQSKYHWPGMYKDVSPVDHPSPWIRQHLRRARDVIAPNQSAPGIDGWSEPLPKADTPPANPSMSALMRSLY